MSNTSIVERVKSIFRTDPHFRKLKTLIDNLNRINFSQYEIIFRHLNSRQIKTITDVGANVGQFGIDMRSCGFNGKIYSFEPVTEFYNNLQKLCARDGHWSAYKMGLGSEVGFSNINVSKNAGLSSSILQMSISHESQFPDSITNYTERIEISTLDVQLDKLGISSSDCLLKIDVQGYEYEVLMGALSNLPKIPLVLVEISVLPLYIGEKNINTLLEVLSQVNHYVIDIYRGIETREGDLLQVDVLTALRK